MKRRKKKDLTVTLTKMRSRATIGKLPGAQVIPNKKRQVKKFDWAKSQLD